MENVQKEMLPKCNESLMDQLKKISHLIKPAAARSFILKFKTFQIQLLKQKPTYPELPNSETFRADMVKELLQQQGCEALRIHLGINNANQVCIILSGVDHNGKDMVQVQPAHPHLLSATPGVALPVINKDAILLEDGQRCPKNCPPPSEIS